MEFLKMKMKNAKNITALFLSLIALFSFVGCNNKKLTKNEEIIIEQVEYWSTWDLNGYYFKNVQVIGSPKICNEFPIVEITVTFELEEITAGGWQHYKVGEIYQKTNRCFYEESDVTWLHENSDGTTEERTYHYHKNEWLQEYDWERMYWNKNLTFHTIDVDNLKINETIDEFIKSNNERKRKYDE